MQRIVINNDKAPVHGDKKTGEEEENMRMRMVVMMMTRWWRQDDHDGGDDCEDDFDDGDLGVGDDDDDDDGDDDDDYDDDWLAQTPRIYPEETQFAGCLSQPYIQFLLQELWFNGKTFLVTGMLHLKPISDGK